jgi:hypothetical protein
MSEALWARLQADGLVEGERPAPGKIASPWYVRAMLGIAGWIGAFFLILFVGVAFAALMNDGPSTIVLGALCCGAAWFIFSKFDGNDFAEQFALVISLVGQMLVCVGLGLLIRPEQAAYYLLLAAVEAGLALLIPNFLHRVLATSGAAVALALAVYLLQLHGLSAPLLCAGLAYVWLEPKRWAADGKLWRPVGYGLVLALLLAEMFRIVGAGDLIGGGSSYYGAPQTWIAIHGPMIGRGLIALVLGWVAFAICRSEGLAPNGRTTILAVAAAVAFGLLAIGAPGLASAVLVLLLGFAAGNRILMAVGILSLLGFVSHYYYSLYATLLEKSGLLAATGLVLLGACFALRRTASASAATEADHG